jgi:3-oxoadipate enol-lactonase
MSDEPRREPKATKVRRRVTLSRPAREADHGDRGDRAERPLRIERPDPTPPRALPPGRAVELPERGTTWVHHAPGPEGAPTLMLLHGWTATAGLNWFGAYEPLSTSFNVVGLDHRGHGRGIRSKRRFRLADCADDAAALADELGIDTFIPVGYSMGGPIAQLTWHRHPDRVDGLVLCATSRNFTGSAVERAAFSGLAGLALAARVTPESWRTSLNERVIARKPEDGAIADWARSEMRRNDPRAIVEAGRAIGAFSSHDWITEVDVPAAVVVTQLDSVVPPARQRKLAEAIPGATVHAVRGDHGVCALAPQVFVPVLREACASVAERIATPPATASAAGSPPAPDA